MRTYRWWTAGAAGALVLAFGVAQQSGALWRGESRIDGGIVRSGTLALRVGGAAPETQQRDYLFAGFGGTALGPASVVQKPLTVRNAGDVDMRYRLQSIRASSSAVPLDLTVWLVGAESDCSAAAPVAGTPIYAGPIAAAQAPAAPGWAPLLAPGASAVWCFRATVGADALPNTATTVTLGFLASSS